jgi:hypothetical protein
MYDKFNKCTKELVKTIKNQLDESKESEETLNIQLTKEE